MNERNTHDILQEAFTEEAVRDAFAGERERDAWRRFGAWCEAQRRGGALPVRSRVYAALVTLDRLLDDYDLDREAHSTPNGAQVKRQTQSHVARLLARFGETRPIPAEAGRTSLGSLSAVEDLLDALRPADLGERDREARNAVLTRMMEHLARVAGAHAEREAQKQARIRVAYDPTRNASQLVGDILERADPKAGAVAQHLVGAKLQIRLPGIDIPNHSYATADVQTGRRGDFEVNDTVFHVTVAPMDGHYAKCASDVRAGFRVYLLVRETVRVGAEQIAHSSHHESIAVQSVEAFVGQNLDELAAFDTTAFARRFRRLLEVYNERVEAVEADTSLLIEIPDNLPDDPAG